MPDLLEENLSQKKKKKKLFVISLGAAFLFLLIIFFGYMVFRSKVFQIQDIDISGANQVSEDVVKTALFSESIADSWMDKMLGQSNMIAWPEHLNKDDLESLPAVKEINIRKDYSEKKVYVSVTERVAVGIWCVEKENPPTCYWFDDEGVLFKPAFSSEGNLIRVVRDYAHTSLGLGNTALSKNLLPNLFEVLKVVEEADLSIKEIGLYDLLLEEVELTTFSGPRMLFSLRFKPEGATNVIRSIFQKRSLSSLSYIDFRVENKVYYK